MSSGGDGVSGDAGAMTKARGGAATTANSNVSMFAITMLATFVVILLLLSPIISGPGHGADASPVHGTHSFDYRSEFVRPWANLTHLNQDDRRLVERLKAMSGRSGNILMPIFTNAAWVDMALNLVYQLRVANTGPGYFIYAWDRESCSTLERSEPELLCYYNRTLGDFSRDEQPWGTSDYFQMINSRLDIVLWIMEYTGASVFMLDTDMVVRSDPLAHVEPDRYDLQYQEELPGMRFDDSVPTLNGGCWFAKNSPSTIAWLQQSIRLMKALKMPDQDAMNAVLRQMKDELRHSALPRDLFPNGFVYYIMRYHKRFPQTARPPVVIHSNWISGKMGKVLRMTDDGGWLVDEWLRENGGGGGSGSPNSLVPDDRLMFSYSQHSSNYASLDEQVSKLKKLVHVATYFGGSIVMPKTYCYRQAAADESCDVDIIVDFVRMTSRHHVHPASVISTSTRRSRMRVGQLELPILPADQTEPILIEMAEDGTNGSASMTYDQVAGRYPLDAEHRAIVDGVFEYSGFIVNEVRTSMGYINDARDSTDDKPFVCLYDDKQHHYDVTGLITAVMNDMQPNDPRAYKLYWVNADPTRRHNDYYRRSLMQAAWPSRVVSGWDILWYGMRELEDHLLPSYVQMMVCARATFVYINSDLDTDAPGTRQPPSPSEGNLWFAYEIHRMRTASGRHCRRV